jgi:hypothetical protein
LTIEETEAASDLLARRRIVIQPKGEVAAGAVPCFFWPDCQNRAEVEKVGKSVCRSCAAALRGTEYPLREPTLRPLYRSGFECAEACDMTEEGIRQ